MANCLTSKTVAPSRPLLRSSSEAIALRWGGLDTSTARDPLAGEGKRNEAPRSACIPFESDHVRTSTAVKKPSVPVVSGVALKYVSIPGGGGAPVHSCQMVAAGATQKSGWRSRKDSIRSSFSHPRIEQVA